MTHVRDVRRSDEKAGASVVHAEMLASMEEGAESSEDRAGRRHEIVER